MKKELIPLAVFLVVMIVGVGVLGFTGKINLPFLTAKPNGYYTNGVALEFTKDGICYLYLSSDSRDDALEMTYEMDGSMIVYRTDADGLSFTESGRFDRKANTVTYAGEVYTHSNRLTVDEDATGVPETSDGQAVSGEDVTRYESETQVTQVNAPNSNIPGLPDGCTQAIEVLVDGINADVTLYEYESGAWVARYTCSGYVGKNGITYNKRAGDYCTPAGIFPISFCFGMDAPQTNLSFVQISSGDVWVNDDDSAYYNTLQNNGSSFRDWSSSENMYDLCTRTVNTAIVFDFNGDGINPGTPGLGNTTFLNGRSSPRAGTAADIDIQKSEITVFLSYLDNAKSPVIDIHSASDGSRYY